MEDLLKNLKDNNEKFSDEYLNLMKEYYSKLSNQDGAQLNKPDSEGGMLIVPNVHCCIKTIDSTGQKVFINITSHDKIDQPKEEHILELENQYGIRLPLSLSDKLEDFDTKNNICQVYDVIFNTNVVNKSETDPNIFALMVNFTVERIRQKFNHELSTNYVKMKNLKYKGKTVRPQRVRVRTGPKIEEVFKPDSNSKITVSKDISNEVNEKGKTPDWALVVLKTANLSNEQLTQLNMNNFIGKKYTIDEYNHNNCQNGYFLYYDGFNANPKYGQALIYIIDMNIITKANAIKLSISDEGLVLNCGKIYNLEITFPYKIDSTETYSLFESSKRLLYILLPFYEKDISMFNSEEKTQSSVKISDDYLYDVLV